MPNPLENITSLPPKTLGIIVVSGVGLGLAWKKWGQRNPSANPVPGSAEALTNADTSKLALAGSSSGNLGSGYLSPVQTDGGTREIGQIALPVVWWVVNIGGEEFLTDGVVLRPLEQGTDETPQTSTVPVPQPTPTPAPSPTPTPTYKVWVTTTRGARIAAIPRNGMLYLDSLRADDGKEVTMSDIYPEQRNVVVLYTGP